MCGTYVAPPGEFPGWVEEQGYAVPRVSFGRRLALFFVLIAIVPMAALIAILIFVSNDSERGKADARIAAGLQTAFAVYRQRSTAAAVEARRLARDPALALALRGDRADLRAWARAVAKRPAVSRVELLDDAGVEMASAGAADSIAFARVGLVEDFAPRGALRVSSTTGPQYVNEVRRLTRRELVLRRGAAVLASTVPPPSRMLESNETAEVKAGGVEYRGHQVSLSGVDRESLLILGPTESGGFFGVGRAALGILIWFLVTAIVLAWLLSRTLTRLHRQVQTQAITDPLTGLWNRRYLAETLDREVARAIRFGNQVSLIILDVDDFKQINDREGHLQGDIVLEYVAQVVRETTRSIDVAARYGGDELAVILVETDREGAAILAERLRERTREREVPLRDEGSMGVTISAGVATVPDSAGDLESLVDAADRALLRAKRAGKNQIRSAPATGPATEPQEPRPRRASGRRTTPRR
jgi:diguanylate cyclase (GGDEF)-like protein